MVGRKRRETDRQTDGERERERETSVQSCTNNDGNNVDLVGRQTHPCNILVSPLRCSRRSFSFRLYPRFAHPRFSLAERSLEPHGFYNKTYSTVHRLVLHVYLIP